MLIKIMLLTLAAGILGAAVSEPKYKVKLDRTVRVSMRDGVEIAAVIVRPDAEGRFPAIMSYHPYRRVSLVRASYSEQTYNHHLDGASYFAERGYAVIHYDVRGTGNSGGSTQDIYSADERKDAYEMVEWIAAQPWCTGNVGMWGMSYGGVVQWQVGVQNPPHLKTLVVGSSNDDVYLDWTYPGGSLRPYMFDSFSPLMTARNFAPPDIDVVGERWSDLWKLRLEKNIPWGIGFISNQVNGSYWTDRSLQPDYSRIKVPVMLWSGWADCYPTPILRAFSRIQVPKKVLIGPWGHWWPEMALAGPQIDGRYEFLKWFDQWLKGIDTGVLNEPPVTMWVRKWKEPAAHMYIQDAGFWRHEKEWPPARVQRTNMYFHSEGRLGREPFAATKAEQDSYRYNPAIGITAGIYWGGGVLPWGMPIDQRYDDAKSQTYTSPPLTEDLEVMGDPKAILYISSSADTAYFHVKVTDVAPYGTSKWLTDGGLLASHRNSHAKPEPLTPGEVYELPIDLKYISYVFPAGHRIRVSVASSDFQNAWPAGKAATNVIHRGNQFQSRVILPVAPPQNPKLPEPKLKPSPRPQVKPEDLGIPKHYITYDLVNRTTTVHLESFRTENTENGRASGEELTRSTFTVSEDNPADAVLKAMHAYTIKRPEGTFQIDAHEVVTSDVSSFRYLTQVEVKLDGKPHFDKSWRVSVPRKLN